MKDKVYLDNLYMIYKDLFTDHQKNYFEDYHYYDLSLGEIAENYNVSRNAIYSQIKRMEDKLLEYEDILGIYSKKNKALELLKDKVDEDTYKKLEGIW